ncbi:hypothetical protein BCR33DRAFT_730645 [Rhizoclosmatium globosum]|uniref:Uncharacterized protein n=1 Tax=Rhizoclosmatium globosum TaxID=329046 RepID=A0A1Y2ABY5_9FUNG|nr:hypothetical protein BCR33DRAFT_730645 [Rhizoclosmatium globosum]|eukprot:ORY19984.1 hypothetical protein BCR33DRAFT_730645 [Rhizoclosmatium globosum]
MQVLAVLSLFAAAATAQLSGSHALGLQCWHYRVAGDSTVQGVCRPVVGYGQPCKGQSFPDPLAAILPNVAAGADLTGPICNSQNCKLDQNGNGPFCI